MSRRYPTSVGRISGGGLSFGDFSLATQRKVTRPRPKGGRNPVEGSALASHGAQPHQGVNRRLRNSVKFCQGAGETPSRAEPSRPIRRSSIKGLTRWFGNPARVCRRGTDDFLRCNALRLLHPTVFHCVAKPHHHIQSANVRIRDPIRTKSGAILISPTLALSRRERGHS